MCKNCGSYLVIRKSKEGNEFLGCINYPNCRYTKSIN
ncbi:MAG: topoisomerase DNA-binding C4 zinc finger domain-containing protein [Ignavibacteriales bacterium]|nr:topoisomerase DNA-binding C4 zinc finger domain-containing protein [Ignavibacteriales bacterium]